MINPVTLFLLVLAGFALGSVYFGGLWATLRRLPQYRYPFFSVGGSALVRLMVLLGSGAWLLRHIATPALPAILFLGVGVWLSRMLLVVRLLRTIELNSRPAYATPHPTTTGQGQ
ncbi:MAG: ATP synthase subunit I [Elainellaceae cyanobacterium]